MNNDKECFGAIVSSVARTFLSCNPFTQCVMEYYDVLNEKQLNRKIERLFEMWNDIKENLEALGENINEEYVKQGDFLDIVEEVTTKVINERSEEKRRYYKNIFLHSILTDVVDYDITEKYLNLLYRLEYDDVVVFAALHHPDKMNEDMDFPLVNPNDQVDGYRNYSILTQRKSVVWALTMLLEWSDEKVRDSLNVLQRERLIEEGTDKWEQSINGSPVMLLKNHLTIKGRSFAKYLMM